MGKKRYMVRTILLFLVIVAIVAILFQVFFRGTGPVEESGGQISLEGAIGRCENYSVSDIISYCTSIYRIDINEDRKYSDVPYQRKNNLTVCENSLFCWTLVDNIPGERCILELCSYYIYTVHLSPEEATLKVFGYYTTDRRDFLTMWDQEEFKDKMLEYERYKSKKKGETGFIFIGSNCASDDIVVNVYRKLGIIIIFQLLNQSIDKYEIGLARYQNSNYRYLYISKSDIKEDKLSSIASLYGDDINKIPDAVPLCALLASP